MNHPEINRKRLKEIYESYGNAYHNYQHAVRVTNAARRLVNIWCCSDIFISSGYTKEYAHKVLEYAAMYHDAVYVVGAEDNEEKSAQLLLDHYGEQEEAVVAAGLIRKTTVADHLYGDYTIEKDLLLCILLDADLNSLACDYWLFKRFQLSILKENNMQEDKLYMSALFLQNFYKKDKIYRVRNKDNYISSYQEISARYNILKLNKECNYELT